MHGHHPRSYLEPPRGAPRTQHDRSPTCTCMQLGQVPCATRPRPWRSGQGSPSTRTARARPGEHGRTSMSKRTGRRCGGGVGGGDREEVWCGGVAVWRCGCGAGARASSASPGCCCICSRTHDSSRSASASMAWGGGRGRSAGGGVQGRSAGEECRGGRGRVGRREAEEDVGKVHRGM